jgi:hypothetical protein
MHFLGRVIAPPAPGNSIFRDGLRHHLPLKNRMYFQGQVIAPPVSKDAFSGVDQLLQQHCSFCSKTRSWKKKERCYKLFLVVIILMLIWRAHQGKDKFDQE